MSYSEVTTDLTDKLITAVTRLSLSTQASRFRKLRESVRVTLKDYQAPATDKTLIDKHLRGLQEKFRILNNDELADALESRLGELSKQSTTWTPEVLSLLVQLSNNPVAHSRVEGLDALKRLPLPPALTWAQILADDPLDNNEGIWDSIDFEDGSSAEDLYSTPGFSPSIKPVPSSSDIDDHSISNSKICLKKPIDGGLLRKISEAQYWKVDRDLKELRDGMIILTEIQAIREALFMLLGLPTAVFQKGTDCGISSSKKYSGNYISAKGLEDILMSLASLGQKIACLRIWTASPQSIPIIQSLQAGLSAKLQVLDTKISDIEAELINPNGRPAMTLLRLHQIAQAAAHPFLLLVSIIDIESAHLTNRPFEVLEEIYSLICDSEGMLDWDSYRFFADLFFPCFKTYLKPLQQWMESGEANEAEEILFVTKTVSKVPRESLWQDQYTMLKDEAGKLRGPHFLESIAQRIFNIGKTAGFMRSLDLDKSDHRPRLAENSMPQFEALIEQEQASGLSPFSEVFSVILETWVTSIHRSSSSTLREIMGNRCGLWTSLDALEHIYLSRDGSLTSQIVLAISERMDWNPTNWADQFVLTDLFRRLYGQVGCVKPELLTVHPDAKYAIDQPGREKSMALLRGLICCYRIPWAVANIIKPESFRIYQRIAILMLQLLRAKHLVAQKLPPNFSLDVKLVKMLCSLRQRQLWFLDTIHSHLATVLSAASLRMKAAMGSAGDLDDMIVVHEEYITTLEKSCFLSGSLTSTHQAIMTLLDMAVIFKDLLDAPNPRFSLTTKPPPKDYRSNSCSSEGEEDDGIARNPKDTRAYHMSFELMLKMSINFEKLLGFVIAGLQDALRSGVEPCYTTLVENLAAWGTCRQ